MCQFFSALVLRNGDVLHHPMLDSHADLVTYFGLPDATAYHQHFAKVELTPVDWFDASTWTFRLDEETAPGWWADVAIGVEATLRATAARMIVMSGTKRLIVDGCWIIGGTAVIHDVRGGRLLRVGGAAQVHGVRDSAQVHDVWDSAQVHDVGGAAQVHDVRGAAQVRNVGPNAILDESAKAHVCP